MNRKNRVQKNKIIKISQPLNFRTASTEQSFVDASEHPGLFFPAVVAVVNLIKQKITERQGFALVVEI